MEGRSEHTIKAFKSDLNLLVNWAGFRRTIGSFGTEDLNRFLHWMVAERGKPCSPKSYARRVTTLKNFFSYLHIMDAIPRDPSAAVIQKPVKSPLPEIMIEGEIERALNAAERARHDPRNPDARPHLLLSLLLQTGIKKSETVALKLEDIIRKDPQRPILWVRYANPRMRYKERKIEIRPEFLQVLDEYVQQRKPQDVIFDCTARNLEYVLRDVAHAAGLPLRKLSFETLRWTCAVRDYSSGVDAEKLRQKLGLSRISWRETNVKLAELVKKIEG
jgi:integrase/recombinase XerD